MTKPFRLIQITDTHLFDDSAGSLLGVNTFESFCAVLEAVKREAVKPDLLLITGDLSQDYSLGSYQRLADEVKKLQVPAYFVPGNHDDSKVLAKVYPQGTISGMKHIVLEHWHLILLDSHQDGVIEGQLSQGELNYLQHCLEAYPEHHAIVVFHHHPILLGVEWLDKYCLKNADVFWEKISAYPRVHSVLFGHIHQQQEGIKNGVKYYSTPSTCIQFKRGSQTFALEDLAQGYRWLELSAEGLMETGVVRLAKYVGQFQQEAGGY